MATARPCLAFLCAHLCDERLFAAQLAALGDGHDCRVFVFREEDSMRRMAETVLAGTPPRFTLIGLSLGGYVAFEVLRRAAERLDRLALLDTLAGADNDARRTIRLADIATVRDGGIEALIPALPSRWMLPEHARRPELVELMAAMARSIGANGQRRQQRAMLARPDSFDDLARLDGIPTLLLCGEQDRVTPVAEHRAMAERITGAELEIVPGCGHLSTLEQPEAVARRLVRWLAETAS
ncbi:MAG: alpha/beta hydrolase [Pseudomonadota bacterium]|nr:alpha/beta hydrolase [Pseudomonadota bacterium]